MRFHIIRNGRIENVGKSQSCMVSKLRIIWKQTVVDEGDTAVDSQSEQADAGAVLSGIVKGPTVMPQPGDVSALRTGLGVEAARRHLRESARPLLPP